MYVKTKEGVNCPERAELQPKHISLRRGVCCLSFTNPQESDYPCETNTRLGGYDSLLDYFFSDIILNTHPRTFFSVEKDINTPLPFFGGDKRTNKKRRCT